MDAHHSRWYISLTVLLLLGGCTLDSEPTARDEERDHPRRRHEPPQVVEQEPQNESDTADDEEQPEVDTGVIDYIRRVDDAYQRTQDRAHWQPHSKPRYLVDTQSIDEPPASAPVGSPADPESTAQSEPDPPQPDSESQIGEFQTAPAIQPPQLGNIEVHAATRKPTQPSSDPAAAEINSPATATVGPTSLREFLEQVPWADDESFRAQLDRRIMWALAGDSTRAHEPMEMVSAEQQQLADAFIDALLAVRDWHLGNQTSGATAASRELAELQNALRQLSEPSIPIIALCSAVRGFGQYDEISPPRFLAGTPAEFVLYCELRDFVTEKRDDGYYYSSFDMTTTILNRAGDTVLELEDPGIIDRCRNLRSDCFIPRLVRLPTTLSPGRYVAKVTIVDKLGQNVTENRATFELVARP